VSSDGPSNIPKPKLGDVSYNNNFANKPFSKPFEGVELVFNPDIFN